MRLGRWIWIEKLTRNRIHRRQNRDFYPSSAADPCKDEYCKSLRSPVLFARSRMLEDLVDSSKWNMIAKDDFNQLVSIEKALTWRPVWIEEIGNMNSLSTLVSSLLLSIFSTGGAITERPTISSWSRSCERIVSASIPIALDLREFMNFYVVPPILAYPKFH